MSFRCGIVGLPNVGKSTLFNALTQTMAAEAANYPFATIEPNTGRVSVPDIRLDKLAKIASSAKIIPNQIEFVDIAGLVRGASKGEGLGNQFLANIREVEAICHVVRCFDDGNITHVEESIDPMRDIEIIETELMLSDLESLEKREKNLEKKARANDKESAKTLEIVQKCLEKLRDGIPASAVEVSEDDQKTLRMLQLITTKPVLYICNVDEDSASQGNAYTKSVYEYAEKAGSKAVIVSAEIESEVAQLSDEEEKTEFLSDLGLEETGLAKVIRAGYSLLGLISFFTIGPKEARAWNLRKGLLAPQAAGEIHTDFERGFIVAETIAYDDYIEFNGEHGCKEHGKLRIEGKTYQVHDGDIFHFRFNV